MACSPESSGKALRQAGWLGWIPERRASSRSNMYSGCVVSITESDSPWIGDANPPVMTPVPLLLSQVSNREVRRNCADSDWARKGRVHYGGPCRRTQAYI
ncbi:hypothetical protein BO78DRAFT_398121 [Aspergillus sclerotiicarbonarius CBS 121057]|uniref:Uncharacterized protein n=1 Tax=Aspergillus sclerotiicarbonarius (strain CBS 121057 / IBT 28362) TaxID=1448318 RepID=A0A319E693_ASPSB|nr:hypothetical protein BO78DRAFT_398121 [Aspergillus sclerotiicarbonarius CBS 121057]